MATEDVLWAIEMAAAIARGKEYNGKCYPPWQVTPRHMQLGCDDDFARVLSKHNFAGLKAFKARVAEYKKKRAQESQANVG